MGKCPLLVATVLSTLSAPSSASTLRFIDPSPNLRTYLRSSMENEELPQENTVEELEVLEEKEKAPLESQAEESGGSEIDSQSVSEESSSKIEVIEALLKKDVKIGEDCNSDTTACQYFKPTDFAYNDPSFMDEVSKNWKLASIDQFCEVAHPWAVEMFGFDCNEEGLSDSTRYCRPANMQNVDLDSTPYKFSSLAYWNLPMSFTFKHVRKAGGNSFLRAMWNIDGSDQPNFQVTKIRASIDEDADRMAEERMSAIERDQIEGRVHPLFLTVRNPVSRFVSSVSQVLGDVAEVEEECWSENGSEVLRCVLGLVEEGLNNIHTIPMFADIYCNVKGRNVEVSMYDLKDMASVLKALGLEDDEKANPSKFKLSVEDLDSDMIQRICALYAWDVKMMELSGFEVPECR